MSRRRSTTRTSGTWLSVVLIVVLAIGVGTLAFLAWERTRGAVATGTPRPVPTFTSNATDAASPTPTPTPTPTTSPPGAAERSLSIGSGAMWRATAGQCGVVAPVLERSTDDGRTWSDVTPHYRGIAQILTLTAFAGTEADMVALVGTDCQLQDLRTFTQGRYWESYPDVLAASAYVDPVDAAAVVTPSGRIPAPCAAPWGLRSTGSTTALICDGTAYTLDAELRWQAAAEDAVAVDVGERGLVTATVAPDCGGVLVSSAGATECVEGVDSGAPVAVAATDDGVLVWAGDQLLPVG